MESPQPTSIDIALAQHYKFSKEDLLPQFLEVMSEELRQQVDFINTTKSIFKAYEESLKKGDSPLAFNTRTLYEALRQPVGSRHTERTYHDFDDRFSSFNREIDGYIADLDHKTIREQDKERFLPQPGDSIVLKALKYHKRSFYSISQLPVKTGNMFRRLFRRPVAPPRLWHHHIPLRQLVSYYLKSELALGLQALFYETNGLLAENSQKLHKLTSVPDTVILEVGIGQAAPIILSKALTQACDPLMEEIRDFEESLSARAGGILDQVFAELQDAYYKVGTIELKSKKFSSHNLAKKLAARNRNHAATSQRWSNTQFAIYERWRMDGERLELKYALLKALEDTTEALHKRTDFQILPHLEAIANVLKNSEERLGAFSGDKADMRTMLVKERRTIAKELKHQKIPQAVEALIEQALASLVGTMESTLENGINRLRKHTTLSKNTDRSKETKSSELQSFSLQELLSHATFPEFKRLLGKTKSTIVQDLDKVQKALTELSNISDFNLESALAMLESEDKPIEESVIVAKEGLQRATAKCDDIAKEVIGLKEKVLENLNTAVEDFNRQLDKLSDPDNIFDLQLQIAKAKALGRGRVFKGQALELLRTSVPYIRNYSYKTTQQAIRYYQRFKSQYGLAKAPTLISAEISDYLAEVNSSIAMLPFVYQRLFDIAPLKEWSFYEERTRETAILKKAYNNWTKGHYAPVVVVGEKGAGATTLINFFIKSLPTHFKILQANDFPSVPDQKALLSSLSALLNVPDTGDAEKIVSDINSLPDRYIVVMENLQQFYLRRVGGFETLKTLLKIMSRTNKKIFWISSCHTYTWHYLDKTLDISDFFGYINFLEGLKDEQIVQAILKRHQMSGYNIRFEAPPEIRLSRKYRRLSDTEKQDYLKNQFFLSLNRFAKNNLSLALIYWLRSTKGVEGNVISFGFINPLNFGFLEAISTQKITILHAMLLHGTLSAANLADILSKDPEDLKMLLLLLHDDGIIVEEDNRYTINPLLYRQTVNLLQSRNFL